MKLAWCGLVFIFACHGKSTPAPSTGSAGSGSSAGSAVTAGRAGSASASVASGAGSGSADAGPPWTSHPIELTCGAERPPMDLPPAQPSTKPSVDRQLARGEPLTQCQDQASIEATCACLVGSIATWGARYQLAAPATCKPMLGPAGVRMVGVQDNPADPDAKVGGSALVLLAKHGTKWSAVEVVDSQGDSAKAAKVYEALVVVAFEAHPSPAGMLYWIETRSGTREIHKDEHTLDGRVSGTLCTVDAQAAVSCAAPVKLGSWTYTYAMVQEECKLLKLEGFLASFDASGISLALAKGTDTDGIAGRYRR